MLTPPRVLDRDMGGHHSSPTVLRVSSAETCGDDDKAIRLEAHRDFLQQEAAGAIDYGWIDYFPEPERARLRATLGEGGAEGAAVAGSGSAPPPPVAGGQGAGAAGTGVPSDRTQIDYRVRPIPPFTAGNHAGAEGAGVDWAGVLTVGAHTTRLYNENDPLYIPPFTPKPTGAAARQAEAAQTSMAAEQQGQVRSRRLRSNDGGILFGCWYGLGTTQTGVSWHRSTPDRGGTLTRGDGMADRPVRLLLQRCSGRGGLDGERACCLHAASRWGSRGPCGFPYLHVAADGRQHRPAPPAADQPLQRHPHRESRRTLPGDGRRPLRGGPAAAAGWGEAR
jgi:hypothetical protein